MTAIELEESFRM